MSDGSCLPPPLGSRSGRVLLVGLLCVLLLVALPSIGNAQTSVPQPTPALSAPSMSLAEMTNLLVQRLIERTQQVTSLESSLQRAELSFQAASQSRDNLATDLLETSNWLDASKTALTLSLAASAQYRAVTETQIKDIQRERNTWKWFAIGGGVIAGVATVAAIVVAVK